MKSRMQPFWPARSHATNGIHGHPNVVAGTDGRKAIGRFGWKADMPRLELFVADALRTEHRHHEPARAAGFDALGAATPLAVRRTAPKDDGTLVIR